MSSKNVKKRKERNELTDLQKAEVYQKVKKGISRTQLCTDYNISKQTVSRIMQDERYNSEKQVINSKVKKISSASLQRLNEELHNWCLEQEKSGATTSYKQLREEAKKIIKKHGEGPASLSQFLHKFQINYKIQLVFSIKTALEHVEVDEELLNWLLEQMINKESISKKTLKDKTEELMKEYDVPLDSLNDKEKARHWRKKFEDCYKILIEPDIFNELIQKDVETNQSDKTLDEQLLDWLLRRKRLGVTISHEILTRMIQKLLDNLDTSKKMDEGNWLHRINKRYLNRIPKSHKPKILQSHDQKSHETAGTSKLIIENVTEENIAVEGIH